MNVSKYITIDKKHMYLPITNEEFEIGTLLLDFLELDLSTYQKEVEVIKQLKAENIRKCRPTGRGYKGYKGIILQIDNNMSDEEKYVRMALYDALKATEHPYAYEVEYSALHDIDYMKLFDIFDLAKLQKEYRAAVNACLLKQDENEKFNPLERYLNYAHELNGKAEIVYTVSKDLTLCEEYIASDISSLLYLEFMKMLQYNIFVRKCENCGRLFAVKGNYNKKYCDRKISGTSKTCQEVGAVNSFKNKTLKDPIIGEYQRAYKRLYARKRTGKITKEELDIQIKKATALRDEAVKGSLSKDEYLEKMINI